MRTSLLSSSIALILFIIPTITLVGSGALGSGDVIGETVDVSEEMQGQKCTVISQERGEISFTIYSRMPQILISKVIYKDQILWETDKTDVFYHHFTVYRLFNKPIVSYLYFTNVNKFDYVQFKFEDNKWIKVNDGEYQILMEKMKNERMLDIKNPDVIKLVKMEEYNPFGITAKIYMNKSKFRIGTVVDGMEILWKSNSWDERCEHVIVHGNTENPKLVHMFIKLTNTHQILYFDRINDKWIQVEKEEFFTKLDKLDKEHERLMA